MNKKLSDLIMADPREFWTREFWSSSKPRRIVRYRTTKPQVFLPVMWQRMSSGRNRKVMLGALCGTRARRRPCVTRCICDCPTRPKPL